MQKFDFTAPVNGAPQVVNVAGRYIKYTVGNAGGNDAGLIVTPGGKPGSKILLYPGQAVTLPNDGTAGPNAWTLANAIGQASISGTVVIGNGKIDDNTTQGVVQVVDGGKARTLANGAFCANMYCGATAAMYSHVQIWNPPGNTNRLILEQFMISANVSTPGQFGFMNTALTTLDANPNPLSKKSGGANSTGQTRNQTNATNLVPNAPFLGSAFLNANTPLNLPDREPIILMPGWGLTFQLGLVNASLQAMAEYYEEPNV